ncbi:unnamed protein product [Rotaria sordida]|uniref:Uncharacterized protein n=1 Tax=Rotaria sordida TaxID=392033 RepID=A0A814CIW5_9BILA|nr:unnamed protein product [Rotaria sordida]
MHVYKYANNLPHDLIAAQSEIECLRNELNRVQISLAASRIGRFCDRQEYERKINEFEQKANDQQSNYS